MTTLFEKIVAREIPADIVFEDDEIIAFKDINPNAPIHFLIVPKKAIPTLNDLTEEDAPLVGRLPVVAAQLAKEYGIAENGYRVVMNCNEYGGQTVYHIHMHLMGGRRLESMG
ncbi:Purine nucleoside phosphoramidase [Halomonadaceae bacterium LMG 33818]|uniref:histidine triad nucleotide-binding protein n=1 Tax=Cernens ardua TaxID=3402176 RepID=UPI003EDC9537